MSLKTLVLDHILNVKLLFSAVFPLLISQDLHCTLKAVSKRSWLLSKGDSGGEERFSKSQKQNGESGIPLIYSHEIKWGKGGNQRGKARIYAIILKTICPDGPASVYSGHGIL